VRMYKRVAIIGYKVGSNSVRGLSTLLKQKLNIPVLRVSKQSTKYQPRYTDYIINWGCSKQWDFITLDNKVGHQFSVNKLEFFKAIKVWNDCPDFDKINIPEWTTNKQVAIADRIGEMDFFFYHNKSAINTLSKETYFSRGSNAKEIKKIKTNTLDNIIENSPYANKKINLLTIDVEGFEMNVLKGFSLEKYLPDIVVVEFTDNSLKKQEFYYHNIQSVINSEIYKHMLLNHYSFVNWIRSDLVFVSKYVSN
ncbi:MAG: FkbM family methyltransferase, partial [Actinobacteria bacterium]|nr:FkbM family methyltransferase [Actinomycetota bacterium]